MKRLAALSALAIAPLTLFACSASHGGGMDGGDLQPDAGSLDAAAPDAGLDGSPSDTGLGPACVHPPSMPCVMPAGDGVLGEPVLAYTEIAAYGLVPALDGARVMYKRSDFSSGTSVTFWETVAFDADVRPGPIAPLETIGGHGDPGPGALLRLSTGEVHFAWRVDVSDASGMGVGTETHAARMDVGGTVASIPPADRDGPEDWTDAALGLAETDDGTLVVGHLTAHGLALRSATRESTVPFDVMWNGSLQMAALPGGRLVAIVEEESPSTPAGRRTAVVLGTAFEEQARATVFDGEPSRDALLVMGDDIYVARFERVFDRLDGSRIRIAHVDAALNRLEPDRALDGWGGLEPTYVALVAWQGQPWLVWRTIDVRFGATPVLYALPLTEEACIGSVDRPLVVLSDTGRLGPIPMRVAADASALWVVTAQREGPPLHAYRFTACP